MKQQIIITDSKNFSHDITGWGYIPKKGQVYRTERDSFVVDYVITETDDWEFITTVFVKSPKYILALKEWGNQFSIDS